MRADPGQSQWQRQCGCIGRGAQEQQGRDKQRHRRDRRGGAIYQPGCGRGSAESDGKGRGRQERRNAPQRQYHGVDHATSPQRLAHKVGEIFGEIKNKITSGYNLREIIDHIDELRFRSQSEKHELSHLYEEVTGHPLRAFPKDLYGARPRDSEYPLEKDPKTNETTVPAKVMPTDFLLQKTKTVWPVGAIVEGTPYSEARQREDLYRVIGAGIGGAAMPTWKGALPEENLWALVYYVQSLVQLRGTPEALRMHERLTASSTAP